jgi:hypothetical protein
VGLWSAVAVTEGLPDDSVVVADVEVLKPNLVGLALPHSLDIAFLRHRLRTLLRLPQIHDQDAVVRGSADVRNQTVLRPEALDVLRHGVVGKQLVTIARNTDESEVGQSAALFCRSLRHPIQRQGRVGVDPFAPFVRKDR